MRLAMLQNFRGASTSCVLLIFGFFGWANSGGREAALSIHEVNNYHASMCEFCLRRSHRCVYLGRLTGDGRGQTRSERFDLRWRIDLGIPLTAASPQPKWLLLEISPELEKIKSRRVTSFVVNQNGKYYVSIKSMSNGLFVDQAMVGGGYTPRQFVSLMIDRFDEVE